ncbi:MAG: PAS domain-containing sensor histidine kinase [Candidatus Sumerlaeota bacterium]|nr:PAS domain-containing sensor histidine kinase [Candidatus Sumerlaeota bacterium]
MSEESSCTQFASAERSSPQEVLEQSKIVAGDPVVRMFLDAVPNVLLILNQNRQIVHANQALADLLGLGDVSQALGLRPGEALDCIHAFETQAGCGTTEFCSACGAVRAILSSQRGQADVQECHLMKRVNSEALDLRVWATPFEAGDRRFTLFYVTDVSNENRRRMLERIFFHDVLNTAGTLRGATQMLTIAKPDDHARMREMVIRLSNRLIEEIQSQRELAAAESGELIPQPAPCDPTTLIAEITDSYRNHAVAKDRSIEMQAEGDDARLETDRTLLGRVIGNLVKNALEASSPGETVTVGWRRLPDAVEFHVHNPTAMPRDVQLQLFQRSFSTKGKGRGLGTYSVKLLAERYLGGRVGFESSEEAGTTFWARFPLKFFKSVA